MARIKTIKNGNVELHLEDYSKEIQKSIKKGIRDGYRKAANNAKKDMKSAIKSEGHVVSGKYLKSIGYQIKQQTDGYGVIIGSKYKISHVSHLIELGTKNRFQKSGHVVRRTQIVSMKFKKPKSVGKIRAYRTINNVWDSNSESYIEYIRNNICDCVNDFMNNSQDVDMNEED